MVTFFAGMTSVSLNISITDDDILENCIETFSLMIDKSSLPTTVIVGSTNQATVNIIDDDCKWRMD